MIETRTKTCCKCHVEKPIEEFYTSGKNKNGTDRYMSRCKECDRKLEKSNANRDRREYQKALRTERREWFNKIKEDLSCSVCGVPFKGKPEICDFHHIDPSQKEEGVGYMLAFHYSKAEVLREMEKCIPVCANCHRTIHVQERARARVGL